MSQQQQQQTEQAAQIRYLTVQQFYNETGATATALVFDHSDQASVWSISARYSKHMILAFPGRVVDVIYALIMHVCPELAGDIVAVDAVSRRLFFRTRNHNAAMQLDDRLRGQWRFGQHSVTFSLYSLAAPDATAVNAIPDVAAAAPFAPAIAAGDVEAHHAAFGILGMSEGTAGGVGVFGDLQEEAQNAGPSAQRPRVKPKGGKTKRKGRKVKKEEPDWVYFPKKRGGQDDDETMGGIGGMII